MRKNHKNDNQGEFQNFRNHPIYNFRNFLENDHSDKNFSREKIEKSYKGLFVKIQEKTLVIFPQKCQ